MTGYVALAQYRNLNPSAGFQLLQSLVRRGRDRGLGRNPEVYAGMMHEPLETAVAQQFFGTSFIPTVLVRGLLGWEPDLPAAWCASHPSCRRSGTGTRSTTRPWGTLATGCRSGRAPTA